MGRIFISEQHHEIVEKHKTSNESITVTAENLIKRGKEFSDMCDIVSEYAQEENKTPESVVKEIFYSAVEYRNFLNRNLPIQVQTNES
ncbi:MAG: hypothetical protein KOO69_03630 [Victivallales bacterium]|nr:hypothetical protein [Victivallales bacterium]